MRIIKYYILYLTLVILNLTSNAQNTKSHSFGFQINPYLNQDLFSGGSIQIVAAFRYNFGFRKIISFGPELSGYYSRILVDNSHLNITTINIGGFARYSLLTKTRINLFLEVSPYVTLRTYDDPMSFSGNGTLPSGHDFYLSGYLAPGISLYNKTRNVSLDLFYKFSNKDFVNAKGSIFSYRINFKF